MKQVELRGTITQECAIAGDGDPLWALFWARWVGAILFQRCLHREAAGAAVFLPANDTDLQALMDAYLLRKAIYELGYELNNRPDWVNIPLQGILELAGAEKYPT